MSNDSSRVLLKPFIESAPAPLFMSGFFQSPPENFHSSETVEVDVQRDGQSVAIPLPTIDGGARDNVNDQYTNKEFLPAILNEKTTIPAQKLLKRAPGESPFADTDAMARALLLVASSSGKLAAKLQRTIELQASQVLQTGQINLLNESGTAVYTLSFLPKGTHFVTPTAWAVGGGTGDPMGDLDSLADVVRSDGKTEPDALLFGSGAWLRFLDSPRVQKFFFRDQFGLGTLKPQARGSGATLQGVLNLGSYQFQCWTYNSQYDHPQTGAATRYLAANKVVMLSSQARLDATFGAIPRFRHPADQALLQFVPQRISSEKLSIDLSVIAYLTGNRSGLVVEVGTRPLLVPTQIDSFGCLTVY